MIKDVAKWLKTAPRKSEIVEIQNGKDKVQIIPQKIIETLLDELTDQNWSTRNFQFSRSAQLISTTGLPIEKVMCDASLELVVTYCVAEKEITRVLVGAVSFDVSYFGNEHVANTAKSLCITNAASDLGKRFGKDLNPKEASIIILGMKPPISNEVKNKIGETLSKLTEDLNKKMIG